MEHVESNLWGDGGTLGEAGAAKGKVKKKMEKFYF